MTDHANRRVSNAEAAKLLGDGVAESYASARIYRGSLDAELDESGTSLIWFDSVARSLEPAPTCRACSEPVTEMVIIEYPHHERIDLGLRGEHAAQAALAYMRRGQVLEMVAYPYQSEGRLESRQ